MKQRHWCKEPGISQASTTPNVNLTNFSTQEPKSNMCSSYNCMLHLFVPTLVGTDCDISFAWQDPTVCPEVSDPASLHICAEICILHSCTQAQTHPSFKSVEHTYCNLFQACRIKLWTPTLWATVSKIYPQVQEFSSNQIVGLHPHITSRFPLLYL